MAHNLGSLVFTPLVQALHEKYGSRRHYARIAAGGALPDRLGLAESAFIAERDSFHMATVGATGWPYVQHRGGPPGFLKIIDDRTLAFADFRGNKQFVSTGVEWVERLRQADYPAVIERVYLIRIEAFDWNCSQHITPRFTADQIQEALKPFERRLQKLEQENQALRESAEALAVASTRCRHQPRGPSKSSRGNYAATYNQTQDTDPLHLDKRPAQRLRRRPVPQRGQGRETVPLLPPARLGRRP